MKNYIKHIKKDKKVLQFVIYFVEKLIFIVLLLNYYFNIIGDKVLSNFVGN